MSLMYIKHLRKAAIVLATLCITSIKTEAMTDKARQEAIKIIYSDEFFSRPENRHRRDDLIKKINQGLIDTQTEENVAGR